MLMSISKGMDVVNTLSMIDEIMFSNRVSFDCNWWGGSLHLEAYVEDLGVGKDYLRVDGDYELMIDLDNVKIEREEYEGAIIFTVIYIGVTGVQKDKEVIITILN